MTVARRTALQHAAAPSRFRFPLRPAGMRRPAATVLLLLLAACIPPSTALAQLSRMGVGELQLLYLESTQGYLAPHVARTFFNSLEFHRELWGWEPSEPVTVVLLDLSDRGNASAGAVPRNLLVLDIAPLSFVYETIAANERMNWVMNHELVHVVAVDQAAGSDRSFRQLFQGKVAPTAEQPESIVYGYLSAPRDSAPRWYHEGIAVFLETWMAGGIGRAQGAYDEMVFRSMVRDGRRFYDPLGLESEGTKIDFQVEVNSYLYGTRFMSYLAFTYGPEALIEWMSRHDGSRAYYASQFEQVYGRPIAEVWQEWIAWEHEFQQRKPRGDPPVSGDSHRGSLGPGAGVGLAGFLRSRAGRDLRGRQLPGRGLAPRQRSPSRPGRSKKIVDVKGPVIYYVTSLAYDEAQKKLFYTTDNLECRDLCVARPGDREVAGSSQGRAGSATSPSTRPTGRSGACATSTASPLWSAFPTRTRSGNRSTRGRTERTSTTSTSRRTEPCCRRRSARSAAARRCR